MLSPPGSSISKYDRTASYAEQPISVPSTFCEAMSIREEVFVHEQHVPLENELDSDDPRSWHWVTYASVGASPTNSSSRTPGSPRDPKAKRGSTASRLAVGTIRLVPPPHPPHPAPGSKHQIDGSEDVAAVPAKSQQGSGHTKSAQNPQNELYVKLGRLATLPQYRKLGLGQLLVNSALEWAAGHADVIYPLPSATEREAARVENEGQGQSRESWESEMWRGLVLVHAQKSVERLWEKYGFVRDEGLGEWVEEGIVHVGMWKRMVVRDRERYER